MEKMILIKNIGSNEIPMLKLNPFDEKNILMASEIVLMSEREIESILSLIMKHLNLYEKNFNELNIKKTTSIENIRSMKILVFNESLDKKKTLTISEITSMPKEKVVDIINVIMNRLALYENKYHKKI